MLMDEMKILRRDGDGGRRDETEPLRNQEGQDLRPGAGPLLPPSAEGRVREWRKGQTGVESRVTNKPLWWL